MEQYYLPSNIKTSKNARSFKHAYSRHSGYYYTVKKGYRFSRPLLWMSLTKLSLTGKNWIIPGQWEFGQWHPGWGRENRIDNLFLQCTRPKLRSGHEGAASWWTGQVWTSHSPQRPTWADGNHPTSNLVFFQLYLDHPVDVGLGPAVGRLAGQLEGSTLLHWLGDGRLLLEVVEDRLAHEHGVGGGRAPLILREADVLSCNQKAILKPWLRIRIHLIRIRIQQFRLNTDPDLDPDPNFLIFFYFCG